MAIFNQSECIISAWCSYGDGPGTINIIQNELQDIKRMQDRILNILEGKINH